MSSDPIARLNAALSGRYRIERELGEGGMATVYLADDLKHERKVALKVLKPELAAVVGADRFLAEIKTTANLQHPHILPLFDSGEADSYLFYVMPYVEGESLRERLQRDKQLPVDEAVRIAGDVAEALHAAHEQGVIHRDIKPANILLSRGRPLVADFGIALAISAAGGGRLTETGLSMGTPYYMSPEQASADRVPGAASDVYSLGCVLYEMLVGEPPYTGSTAQAVLAKILMGEAPTPTEARSSIPVNVDAVIRKSLERLPADRFGSAAALSSALANPAFRHGGATQTAEVAGAGRSVRLPWALFAASSVAFFALAFVVATGRLSPTPGRVEATHLTITLPHGQALTSAPVISPDGRAVVYAAGESSEPPRLYVRDLSSSDAQLVEGTEGALMPFFAPDGQAVAFFAGGRLLRWNRGGGAPQPLAAAPLPLGGTWGDDGTIVFVPVWNGGLYEVSADGGRQEAEALLIPDWEEHYAFVFPRFVPGRRQILFTGWGTDGGLMSLDLDSDQPELLVGWGSSGTATTSGHVLYGVNVLSPLLAGRSGPELVASTVEIVSDVHQFLWSPILWVSASRTGTLAYAPSVMTERTIVIVDESGGVAPVTEQQAAFGGVSVSLDGRIAADRELRAWHLQPEGGWVRVAPENRDWSEQNPMWDPTRSQIVYGSNESGTWDLYARSIGATESEPILKRDLDQHGEAVASDGTIAFLESHPTTGYDIWLVHPSGESEPWLATGVSELHPDFSPDAEWIVYASNKSNRFEVYVGPKSGDPSTHVQVTTDGGLAPLWSPVGDRLFYRRGAAVMAVEIESLDPLRLGSPEMLFDGGWSLPGPEQPNLRVYDVMPDGEHFVMIHYAPAAIPDRINVILNFFAELERRVPN